MKTFKLNEIKIEVTYNCPLACIHCSSDAYAGNEKCMTIEKCKEIIKDAKKIGAKEISFTGGEPLSWDGLVECVGFAHLNEFNISLYSSGNDPNYLTKFRDLKNAGLHKVIFSLYSNVESDHNRITRKRESLQNTIKSIEYVKKIGIEPEIHFVALSYNYQSLEDVVMFANKIGVRRISVLRFVLQGRGALLEQTGALNKEQNLFIVQTIKQLRDKGFDIRTGSPMNVFLLNEKPKCMSAQDRLIIAPDLYIYPCDAFKQVNYKYISPKDEYANLNSCSLSDSWEKSDYLAIIRDAVQSEPEEPCLSCKIYEKCKSGCLAQKFIAYKNLSTNPDPECLKG